MKKIPFCKYNANGNDFILISSENVNKKSCDSAFISRLCRRHTGIGADGLFIVSRSKKYDFFLDYYNADGSWETFCANGSRCAVKFMYNSLNCNKRIRFETGASTHSCRINSDGLVSMSMKTPIYKSGPIAPLGFEGFFIDSGARHFVCESDKLDSEYVFVAGRKIRHATEFQPRGINVNFYHQINNNEVHIKTYEKGVEQVMLSCASGSAAVVFHLAYNGLITSPTTTISEGGNLSYAFDVAWKSFFSTGPAKLCFSGEFILEDYL